MSGKQTYKRVVYALKHPYSEPPWPTITPQVQETLHDLLLQLLTPIGQHRDAQVKTSKVSRRKKTRKSVEPTKTNSENHTIARPTDNVGPPPDISRHVTIGFNSTVRHLEYLAQGEGPNQHECLEDSVARPPLIAVFVCKSALPLIMTAPFPLLVAGASLSVPPNHSTRLIEMSQANASKLGTALRHPNANIVGIYEGAPGSEALEQVVRANVTPVEVPWLRESTQHRYQPLQIHNEEIIVSKAQTKDGKRKRDI